MSAPMLEVRSLTVRLSGRTVLADVSLAVERGSRHVLVGPNGAGKTTLLNTIGGSIRPAAGRILLNGTDITGRSTHHIARLGVGRTWQHPAICGHLTVAENVLIATTARMPAAQRRRETHALLDEADLASHASMTAGQLSYGQQRRLELVIALAGRPQLLLLDEPSAGLADADVERLLTQLKQLGPDVTVLLSEHNQHVIDAIADEITTLDRDRVSTNAARNTSPVTAARRSVRLTAAPGGSPPLLSVRGLTVTRSNRKVLNDVSFDLLPGQILTVTGGNGAGKTTLLQAIAGLIPTAAGTTITLNGQPIHTLSPAQRSRHGIALVPQDRRLFSDLTVEENLQLAVRQSSQEPQWTVHRLIAELPQLGRWLKQRAGTLSGGEQQQVALVRALLTQPRVLLLDEPFTGVALGGMGLLGDLVTAAVGAGTGIVIADHGWSGLGHTAHVHLDVGES